MTLHFVVYGVAQPKGSAKAFMPKGARFPTVTNDNPKGRGWQQLVADGASRAIAECGWRILDDAVRLSVAFYLPRPKKYQRRSVEPRHLTKPDLDKLTRGVGDALTGVAWRDDSQVVELITLKRYAAVDAPPSVEVWVDALTAPILVLPMSAARSLFDLPALQEV
jgi:Holliday junction resolvase RusA-like endonuclease